jgi:hypothetical protein
MVPIATEGRRVARKPSRGVAPLEFDASLRFPTVRSVSLPHRGTQPVASFLSASLREGGFLVSTQPSPLGLRAEDPRSTPEGLFLKAERDIQRGPTSRTTFEFLLGLLGAGFALGTLETYLAGSLVYGLLWVLGAATLGAAFWYRYGRSFESEVIVAAVRIPSSTGSRDRIARGTTGPPVVVCQAGRVRSVLHGGHRTVVEVLDCPIPLTRLLALAVKQLQEVPGERPTSEAPIT